MTPTEKRATFGLAGIMSLRLLGLFMILPVFAIYAQSLPGVTDLLVGIAIGIYGLTQAAFQIPFGLLSDRFGRKPIIAIGLLIFAVGSVIAALSTSIIGIIMGRALQGSGAVGSAILALTADLTREEHRTKAMATLGISIGMSFILAFVLGPLLNRWIGVPGIFWLSIGLTLIALCILIFVVPQPVMSCFHRDTEPVPTQFRRVLGDTELLRLNFGIMLLHWLITSMFIELPIALKAQLETAYHWQVYLPVLVAAVITMVPFIILAEKYRHLKVVFVSAIGILSLSQLGLSFLHDSLFGIVIMLFLFFTTFNLLEATLPSLVSKIAPPESKGTAMGIYSTGQFFGAFLGGVVGGWLHHYYTMSTVFAFSALLAGLWFLLALTMRPPRHLSSYLLKVGQLDKKQAEQLTEKLMRIPGVAEAIVIVEDGIAYLKIDQKITNMMLLNEFSVVD